MTNFPNPVRGEIAATLDGDPYRLCLTLGALAELEGVFAADDLMALAVRFENGRMKSSEAIAVIGAGLRACGNEISNEDVAAMRVEGGAAGFISIVARLLTATFSSAVETPDTAPEAHAPGK